MRKIKIDEKKWKSIIVGIVVFVVVFIGLTIYQQTSNKAQGDVVITSDEIETVDEEIPIWILNKSNDKCSYVMVQSFLLRIAPPSRIMSIM